jgi:hypothetical protein
MRGSCGLQDEQRALDIRKIIILYVHDLFQWKDTMDLPLAINANRVRLLAALAGVAAMIGNGETMLRHVKWAVLAILRPAESAARRLISVAAIGIVPGPGPGRAAPEKAIPRGKRSNDRVPAFPLLDTRLRVDPKERRVPGYGPGVWFLDGEDFRPPAHDAPGSEDPVDAAPLRRRLASLLAALDDIPGQAKRLARILAKKPRPMRAMRPGRPPGFRANGKREIDEVLADCHALALLALHEAEPP